MQKCYKCGKNCHSKAPIYSDNNILIGYYCCFCNPENKEKTKERLRQLQEDKYNTEEGREKQLQNMRRYRQNKKNNPLQYIR
jgi:hypothetical protein